MPLRCLRPRASDATWARYMRILYAKGKRLYRDLALAVTRLEPRQMV